MSIFAERALSGCRRCVVFIPLMVACGLFVFANSVLATGWILPTSFNDPNNRWNNETRAYDGDTANYATDTSAGNNIWGAPLEFFLSSAIRSDRVRVFSDFLLVDVDKIRLEVRLSPSGTWTNVYEGTVNNCNWSEITYTATNIDAGRYTFHWVRSGYQYWLYEFQFYESPPQINLPSCDTQDASSFDETTAIAHGTISDDGGEPCQYRFQYGLTTSYTTNTAWSGSIVSNTEFTTLISGLTTNTTYHFRAQIQNSAGIASGSDKTFTTTLPGTGWVTPTGYTNSSAWTNILNANDDNTETFASCYHNINDPVWSPYLYLTHSTMTCDKIRFMGRSAAEIDQASVELDLNGSWSSVYSNSFTDKQWTEASFTKGTATQARVRFRVSAANYGLDWQLYEFDFHKITGVTLSGQYNGSTPVTLVIDGVTNSTFSNFSTNVFTFSPSLGMGSKILIYYNDNTTASNNAALVTLASGSDMTNLDLTADTLTMRSDFGSSLASTDIAAAWFNDTDIPYTFSGNNITVANNMNVLIPSGHSFAPGASTVTLNSNLVNNGQINSASSTFTFNGATAISGISTTSLNNVTINGTLASHSNLISVAGNWVNNGTFNHNSGTVEFNGNSTISGSSVSSFKNLTITGTLNAPAGTLNISGNLINNGTFNHDNGTIVFNGNSTISGSGILTVSNLTIAAGSVLSAPSGNLYVEGNWSNSGIFSNKTGSIIFSGNSTAVITGSNNFYDLVCNTPGKQINFEAGSNQVVSGTLTLNGSAGNLIKLRSTSSPTRWNIAVPGGAQSVTYVDVQDSNASGNTITVAGGLGSDNNANWIFVQNRYWVGGAGNWSDTNHWSLSSGGAPGVSVPDSTQLVVIDTNSGGGQCSINVSANIKGITLEAGASNTLVQGSSNVTLGSAGLEIKSGAFTGGSGLMNVTGDFKMSGGIFTAPSSQLALSGTAFNHTGGIFSNNTGTVLFAGNTVMTDTITNKFNNIAISGSLSAPSTSIHVSGSWSNSGSFAHNNSTVYFNGNSAILGTSSNYFMNVALSGTLTAGVANIGIAGSFANNGSFNHNNSKVIFNGTSTISGSSTSSFNNITISGTLTSHDTVPVRVAANWINNGTFNHNSGTLLFNGNTTISGSSVTAFNTIDIQNTLTAPAGSMNIAGNFLNNGIFNHGGGIVIFNGTSTIDGTNAVYLNNTEIWGTLTASAAYPSYISGYWINHGVFNNNSGTVVFNGSTDISGANISAFNILSIIGSARLISTERIGDTSAVQLSGTLNLDGQNETIGSLSGSSSITLGSATLTIAGNHTTTFSGNISQTGGLIKQGSGMLTLSGTNTYTGGTAVNGGVLHGNTLSLQGSITNNAGVIFNQTVDGTYSAIMFGSGTMVKNGAATLTMTGNNAYTGSTTISNGTLKINGNNSSANGMVNVLNGAVICGTGTIGGAITVNSGAFISPDTTNTVANLILASTLALNGQYVANITNYNAGDLITAGTVNGNGSVNVILGGGFTPSTTTNWIIITGGAGSSYVTITNNLTVAGIADSHYYLSQNGNNLQLNYKGTLPVVDNASGASNIGTNTATLNGNVVSAGSENPVVRIYWGTSNGGTNPASWTTNENLGTHGVGAFSTVISNLAHTQTYWYRASASNSDGVAWAPASTNFSTTAYPPSLSTLAPSSSTNSAILRGQINPPNDESPGAIIYWGLSNGDTNPASWGASTNFGTVGLGIFSTNVTGLIPGTQYFCNCFASNSAGATWGTSTSFWTIITATVTNDDPTSVTTNSAQLNGIILDTGAQDPNVRIFWGPTDGNTDPASWSNNVNIGTLGITSFSTIASNLLPNTVYYYRCYATNTAGSAWASESLEFTSLSPYAPTNKADIFDDNFDGKIGQNPPSGWTKTRNPTVNVIANNALSIDEDEFASFRRTGNNQALSCTFLTSIASGILAVEWLGQVNVANRLTSFRIRSGATDRAVVTFSTGGTIQYYSNTTLRTTQAYTANTWYRFRLELNVSANNYNFFVNNILCGTNALMRNTGAINTFRIDQGANNAVTLYFDDFEAYTHKKWIGASSTNWNSTLNWAPNGVPVGTNTVRITDGDQRDSQNRLPTMDVSSVITNLLFDECNDGNNQSAITNSFLRIPSNYSLDVNGQIIIESNATLDVTDGGTISCASNFYNYGTFNCGTGTVVFDDNSQLAGTSHFAFNNLVITGALTLATADGIDVSGNWTNNGTFTHNGRSILFSGNTTVSGTKTTVFNNVTITGILTGHSNRMDVAGNWDASSGTYSNNNGKVVLSGTSLQTIDTGGAWNPATTNNNWKNNWNELIATNSAAGGIVFADGFKANKFTCTRPNSTLNFKWQESVTNVFEVSGAGGLNLHGAAGQLIKLRRYGGSGANQWEIAPTGAGWMVSYVDVTDSVNSYTNYINPSSSLGSTGAANNKNWFIPTFVQLSRFSASQTNSVNIIQWQTATEMNNAGFNIYRSETQSGIYSRINGKMILGLGNSLNGRAYSYIDLACTNSTYWYKLEAVEFDGSGKLYGPVSPSSTGGTTPIYQRGATGGSGSTVIPTPVPAGTGSGIYKIFVDETGIYRLGYNFLTNAVTNLSTWVMDNVHIYNQGQEVAIGVHNGGTSLFETNDYIEFYGTNLDTRFTGRNVYWLYYSTNQNTSTPQFYQISTPAGGILTTTSQNRVHFEENSSYEMALSDSIQDDDHWFFNDYMVAWESETNSIQLKPVLNSVLATNGLATVRIALRSPVTDYADYETFDVSIEVNGTALTNEASWSGLDQYIFESKFAQNILVEGTNIVELTLHGDAETFLELVYVNWIDIDYVQQLTAINDSLAYRPADTNSRQYTVNSFTTGDPAVYRITDVRNVAIITNTAVTGSGPYSMTFSDSADSSTVYHAIAPLGYKTPAGIENDISSDLRSTTNSADYIIISHRFFKDAIEPLAAYRRTQGMRVAVVDIQDVYDDFNYGVFSPYAIRSFLAYAKENWIVPAPQYVLLVGDGTYDYRNYTLQPGIPELIPVKLVNDAQNNESPSDNWYISPDSETYPVMFVGRFPARTANDVTNIINKTINYESTSAESSWARKVAFIAGDEEHNDDYYVRMCNRISGNMPAGYSSTNIFRYNVSSDSEMHDRIVEVLNNGVLVGIYSGHGNFSSWSSAQSGQPFFNLADAATLTNSPRNPLIITPTCMNGYFANTIGETICMAEQLLSNSNGAVACISPSGMAIPQDQLELVNAFADTIFKAGSFTAGKAFSYALHMTRNELDEYGKSAIQTTVFFGDPALRLRKWSGFTNSFDYTGANIGDSDGDGIPDGWEIANNMDPIGTSNANTDGDGDGLSDKKEYENHANPYSADTDGDGMIDLHEVIAGTSPADNSKLFKINESTDTENGNILSWETAFGRWYTVQTNDNLINSAGWTGIPGFIKVPGNGSTLACTNQSSDILIYYRIMVTDQP